MKHVENRVQGYCSRCPTRKGLLPGVVLILITMLGCHVQGARYLVDFGPHDGTNGTNTLGVDPFGHYWNNLNTETVGGTIGALVNSTNGTSGISVKVLSTFQKNGILNGALLSPDPNLLGDLAVTNATEDYFYTAAGVTGTLSITNLSANNVYDLRFFGSRQNVDPVRITQYSVTGGGGTFSTNLTTTGTGIGANGYNGNNNRTVSVAGVAPNASGAIQISVTGLNSQFGYINLLDMVERLKTGITNVSASSTISYGTGSVTLTGVVAALLSQYPADSEMVAVTINGVTSNAVISGGAGVFSVNFPAASLVPGTYTVTYLYGGNSNLSAAANSSTSLTVAKVTPTVSPVTDSQALVAGTVSVLLTGVVSGAGVLYPTNNETVAVTVNGVTSNAIVAGGAGGFSVNFPVASLPMGSYPVMYAYAGDASLNAASNTATTLTVTNSGTVGPIEFLPVAGAITNNLTAVGVTDWNYWYAGAIGGGSVLSSEKKSGGFGIRTNLTITGPTQPAASSPALAFSWTDGTPVASVAATNSMIYLRNGGASAARFVVDVSPGSVGEIHFWYTAQLLVGSRGTASVTAVYSDGMAATQTVYFVGTTNEECVIPFKPNATTTLSVTLTNDGEAALSFAAVAVGKATPAIASLVAAPSLNYGDSSITLTGRVSAMGPTYPADGETVAVTIGGITSNATVAGGAGAFSVTFPTATITPGAHSIMYAYGGNGALGAVTNSSTSLAVGKATPAISQVIASPAVVAGTASVALTGVVSVAGQLYAANGETVAVTINGVTSNAVVSGGTGAFSVNFPTASLALGAYAIMYEYAGDASLNAASNTVTSLVVAGGGSSVGPVQFSAAPGLVNLTAKGATDWKYWCGNGPGTLSPVERKSGGGAIRNGLTITTTQPVSTGAIAFNWEDGTPDAVLSTNSLINMRAAGPAQVQFTVDLSAGYTGNVRLWFGLLALTASRTVTVTARYPDGTTSSQSLLVVAWDTQYRECDIPFQAGSDSALTVTVSSDGESALYFGAVALTSHPPGCVYTFR